MERSIPPMVLHSDEEDAAINAGIAADPDTYELDDDFFANARPWCEADFARFAKNPVAVEKSAVQSKSVTTRHLLAVG